MLDTGRGSVSMGQRGSFPEAGVGMHPLTVRPWAFTNLDDV